MLVENVIAFAIVLMASGILATGVSIAVSNYHRTKSMYIARLTAENVHHLVLTGEDVPEKMNGFDLSYTIDGTSLKVNVGRWSFEFEVER